MKKKLISGFLIICMLLGLMAFPAQGSSSFENGDSIYDPVQVQDLTGPRFQSLNITDLDGDLVYYTNGSHSGLMDVFGNEILPPQYDLFSYVWDGYVSGIKGDVCALFYRGKQLTDFRYTGFTRLVSCFRAEQQDGRYVFFDNNGKQIAVPKKGDSVWKVIDIIPNKAILMFKDRVYLGYNDYGPIYRNEEYQLFDWAGNPITKATDHTIEFADENSYFLSGDQIRFDGTVVKGVPDDFFGLSSCDCDGLQYKILCKYESQGMAYYLFDTDYNRICKLDVMTNAVTPVALISDSLLLVRPAEGDSILMNAQGQEISRLPGWFVTYVGVEKGTEHGAPLDRFLMCDGENGYIYDNTGTLISVLEGVKGASNAECYITANLGEYDRALYDLDGNLLFTYDVDSNIICANGIIFQERGNRSAVLYKHGTPLTEYIFSIFYNATDYGLMKVTVSGQKGFYLVNNKGQVQNSVGYDEFNYVGGSYCEYKTGGKTGFLRIVTPGDDVFTDVPYGTWYYDSVETCAELELFNGTSPAKFSPNKTMTRAMLVTVLWRLDGEKTPNAPADFADVPSGSWYTDAVAWASENGIVNGVGKGRFNPNGNVTREQIATILRRYAESKGIDTGAQADLSTYPDAEEISSYAKDAMAWANAVGLINGNKIGQTILLQPKGDATRAQVAAILIRYINNLHESDTIFQ